MRRAWPCCCFMMPRAHDRFTTEVLGAMLDHQTAILDRLEEVHRVLVQIVLAGGSLDDLCEQVVGFFDGAAMVTTTDGRVLASAGARRRARARPGPRLLRPHRPAAHRDRAGRHPRPARPRRRTAPPCGSSPGTSTTACSAPSAATAPHGRRRAPARAGRHGRRPGHHQGAGRLGGREQVPRRVPARRPRRARRLPRRGRRPRGSLGWDIDRPMVVVVAETDEDDDQIDPRRPRRCASCSSASPGPGRRRCAVRDPRAPVMGFSQEVVALVGVAARRRHRRR